MARYPVLLALIMALIVSGAWPQLVVKMVVPGADIADVNAVGDDPGPPLNRYSSPEEIAVLPDGRLVIADDNSSGPTGDPNIGLDEVIIADISGSSPVLSVLADETDFAAAVSAAGGSQTEFTIQSLAVDSNGDVIVLTDGSSPEYAFLFNVDVATGNVEVITGLDATPPSIEGGDALAVIGTTAYIYADGYYGCPTGDSVLSIDTTLTGGTTAATVVVQDSDFQALTSGNVWGINDMDVNSDGDLVLCNSAYAGANDNIVLLDLPAGTLSILVDATDIESDLGATDVGFTSMAVDAANADRIYLYNYYGQGDGDDDMIVIDNAGGGVGDASIFITEDDIINFPHVVDEDGNAVTGLVGNTEALVVVDAETIMFSDDALDGIVEVSPPGPVTEVKAYELYR